MLPLPADAAMGTLISNALLYWNPGQLISPAIAVPAGKSFWVVGMDSAREYYELFVGCTPVWVPAEAMGPTYDSVWNGRPLPTAVVQ
jgi:hypothetical protein